MAAPHLLILDEPTNHLDIDSRRALLDALNDYEGAVILITHDRSLIELVADRLWLTADGHIKPFAGDMDDYARFVLERARQGASPAQSPTAKELQKAKELQTAWQRGGSGFGSIRCRRRGASCRQEGRKKAPAPGPLSGSRRPAYSPPQRSSCVPRQYPYIRRQPHTRTLA